MPGSLLFAYFAAFLVWYFFFVFLIKVKKKVLDFCKNFNHFCYKGFCRKIQYYIMACHLHWGMAHPFKLIANVNHINCTLWFFMIQLTSPQFIKGKINTTFFSKCYEFVDYLGTHAKCGVELLNVLQLFVCIPFTSENKWVIYTILNLDVINYTLLAPSSINVALI